MPTSDIIQLSKDEVKAIFQWVADREHSDHPTTILIGGWAVYTYNAYYGSIDIDIITNSRTRSSMQNYVVSERGYHMEHQPDGEGKYAILPLPTVGSIWIDFATRSSPNRYEGQEEHLEYSLLDRNIVFKEINGVSIPVPSPSLLLLFKLKAAWDRKWRLTNGKSADQNWDKEKLVKDQADILALMDSQIEVGFNLELIGAELERCPFLLDVFDTITDTVDAANKYDIAFEDAKRLLTRFTSLFT